MYVLLLGRADFGLLSPGSEDEQHQCWRWMGADRARPQSGAVQQKYDMILKCERQISSGHIFLKK